MRTRNHVLLPLALLSLSAWAQTRGTFSGTVTDESGAAVPNAKITAADTQKGTKPEAVSESSGAYAIPFLIPGIYDITAEALGIKTFTRQGC
jgi:hypothetical protein